MIREYSFDIFLVDSCFLGWMDWSFLQSSILWWALSLNDSFSFGARWDGVLEY